jgi:hypothetical protein
MNTDKNIYQMTIPDLKRELVVASREHRNFERELKRLIKVKTKLRKAGSLLEGDKC